MSQIQTHSRADNTCLGFKPGNTRLKPIDFKAHKGPDCQSDMIPLRDFEPILTTFNTRKLFQASMVNLNLPGIQGIEGCLLNGHVQAAGRPIFRVAVCADRPKHLDPTITFEMNQTALRGDKDLADGTVATPIEADFPVALQLCQPVPIQAAQQLQIRQSTIPTVKATNCGSNPRCLGNHVLKVIILAHSLLL
jgi:hypothetical protein